MQKLLNNFLKIYFYLILLLIVPFSSFQKQTVWLSSLDLTKMVQGWDQPIINFNSKNKKTISIGNSVFEKGVGTRVKSYVWINLGGGSEKFVAYAGVDNDTTGRSLDGVHRFKIFGDDHLLWQSHPVRYGDGAIKIDLDVRGVQTLILEIINIGKNESNLQLDWADAQFIVSGKLPVAMMPPREPEVMLTPATALNPHINAAKVYGCRPGNPFLYRIPSTGMRPIKFTADNLPAGLYLNTVTGIITGSVARQGDYNVMLHAQNKFGKDKRNFKIRCGSILELTPTMGWNDWYAHYWRVTGQMMKDAADILIKSGMADAGYQYINIDDCWMNKKSGKKEAGRDGPLRNKEGNIVPNSYFKDIQSLTSYIHSKGLKAGIYTSPGPETCAGFEGSFEHEAQDAKQFADWGFDFLKYDWCSYGNTLGTKRPTSEIYQKPYSFMGSLLKKQKRDMVLNICQYGMNEVWKWGFDVGGSSWRTGGDLGFGLNGLFNVALKNAGYSKFSKPGAWNDPDYIQIGFVGNAFEGGLPVHTNLSPNEQYAFMSMWCLLAAPLVYSADLNKLDKFTLNILCNPEVIEIDQDPLGVGARALVKDEESFILIKDLEDGGKAVGFCNGGEIPLTMSLIWSEAGKKGKQLLRDLWRQKDLGIYENKFSTTVPRHSVFLFKISNYHK